MHVRNPLDTPESDSDTEMETSAPPAGLPVVRRQVIVSESTVPEMVALLPENPVSSIIIPTPALTENSYFVNVFEILEYVANEFALYPSGSFNDTDIYQSAEYFFGSAFVLDIDTYNQRWQINFFMECYENKRNELDDRWEETQRMFAAPRAANN